MYWKIVTAHPRPAHPLQTEPSAADHVDGVGR